MSEAEAWSETFVGAFGLVRTLVKDAFRYVSIDVGGKLDFVRAPRLEGTSFKESLDKAVAEQLGLRYKKDYITSGVPRIHLNSRLCGSLCETGSDEPRWYICEFFVVSLYGRQWQSALESRQDVVWLSSRDVVRGHAPDGRRLANDIVELMKTGEVIPPDEVSGLG